MKLEYLKYALDNILHRKLRSWFNVLSILIGIAAVFALISFGQGLSSYANEIANKMGKDKIMAQVGGGFTGSPLDENYFFTEEEIQFMSKIRGVDELTPMTMGSVKVSNGKKTIYTFFIGMEAGVHEKLIEEMFTVKLLEGRKLKKGEKDKVLLGYNYQVPERIFKRPVKKGDKLEINDVEFEVIGFYDAIGNPSDDASIYTTFEGFVELFPEERDKYKYAFLRAGANENPSKVAEKLEEKLRKRRGQKEGEEDFSVQTFEQAIATFGQIINIINAVLVLIASISVVVAAVNIMNTMYTAVVERTKEIGIMKAIGARNMDIMIIFLVEAGVLGLVGAGIGAFFGYLIASGAGAYAASAGYEFLKPIFPAWLIIGCLAFGFLVGSMSGLLPARAASKLRPVDALHYE